MLNISSRLKRIASYVNDVELLVDIGTDHAYLPIYLIQNQKAKKIIAGDILPGPYQSAVNSVNKFNLQDKIEIRMGNGLDIIADERAEVITVSGMGGRLISDILSNNIDKLEGNRLLVLQPMNQEYYLRKWLIKNNYQIIAEEILEEDKIIYEIIVAEHIGTNSRVNWLSEIEIKYGPFLLQEKNDIFYKKWGQELDKNLKIENNIIYNSRNNSEDKLLAIRGKIKELQEIIKRW